MNQEAEELLSTKKKPREREGTRGFSFVKSYIRLRNWAGLKPHMKVLTLMTLRKEIYSSLILSILSELLQISQNKNIRHFDRMQYLKYLRQPAVIPSFRTGKTLGFASLPFDSFAKYEVLS